MAHKTISVPYKTSFITPSVHKSSCPIKPPLWPLKPPLRPIQQALWPITQPLWPITQILWTIKTSAAYSTASVACGDHCGIQSHLWAYNIASVAINNSVAYSKPLWPIAASAAEKATSVAYKTLSACRTAFAAYRTTLCL